MKMLQSQIMKLLSCHCHHLIDILVEFYKKSHISNSFKTSQRAISVNIYQFLYKLLRTRALWRKNFVTSVTSDDMISRKLHISKISVPYIRALHTQGSLSEARSQIGKRFSEKVSNFISCCGTMYMLTHYGKFMLVMSLLFLSHPNQNSALPIIIAENQSHNLITTFSLTLTLSGNFSKRKIKKMVLIDK